MATEAKLKGSEVLVNRRTTTHCEVQQVMVLGESGRVMIGICGGFIRKYLEPPEVSPVLRV